MKMKGRILTLSVLLFVTCILSACGQKGDLYHPEEQAATFTKQLT